MERELYRYKLGDQVSMHDAEEMLLLALLGTESIHGAAQTRLDVAHSVDEEERAFVIDAATEVGIDLNRLFTGFLLREFGQDSFRVQRLRNYRVLLRLDRKGRCKTAWRNCREGRR